MRLSDKKNRPAAVCLIIFFLLLTGACMTAGPRPPMDISAYEAVPRRCIHDDFIILNSQEGDSFSSLAAEYLDDPSKGWLITEFNHIETVTPGQRLIIPLKPFKHGGLRTNGYQTVPVLVYHRFSKKSPDAMTVSESAFEEQMKFLKENDYHVITLDQLMDFLDFSRQIPEKSVVITFDDGWRSVYRIAFPILEKYNFPATLFISTDFIGSQNALSWQQIGKLTEGGFDIQCHTKTHRNLARLEKTESFEEYFKNLKREISIPPKVIKEKLGKTCRYLAYPYGETNSLVIALLKKHGYRGALTLRCEGNPFFVHPYRMNRSVIYGNDDFHQFKKNLEVFRKWREVFPGTTASPGASRSLPDTKFALNRVCRTMAMENEKNKEFPLALLYWKAAHYVNLKEKDILLKISALNAVIEDEADVHFKNGVTFYTDDCHESARKEFLIALAYKPNHEQAMGYLKNRLQEPDSSIYMVKEGDTLKRIASEIYKDPSKDFLIRYFTGIIPEAKPKTGTLLELPILEEKFSVKLLDQDIGKNKNSASDYLFPKTEGHESGGRKAANGFEEEPENSVADCSGNASCHGAKTQRPYDKAFPPATADSKNNSVGVENGETPSELNLDFKRRAEEHYRTGIKFFIKDELKMAIEEWEKTLFFNPAHQKAREDIRNARELLEKYKKLR
jgi:peptidoglycan/xylan/chitin deacetylase (PgdA/CDA1 family)